MANGKKVMTFMQASADFFGKKSGQTLMEFRNELKSMTDQDRAEVVAGLEQKGYEITTLTSVPSIAQKMDEAVSA